MEIIQICLKEAFIIVPMVIGIGILYSYLKTIDISIDGVVILSGIVAAYIWNTTNSYLYSILASSLCGMLCSFIVSLMITKLQIPSIIAGLIFTLIVFPVSVIIIGESMPVQNTSLLGNYKEIPLWLIFSILVIFICCIVLFGSKVGAEIKAIGSNVNASGSLSKANLTIIVYSFVGLLYGFSSALYVHNTGSARSGNGFELLIIGLCSFVVIEKIFNSIKNLLFKFKAFNNININNYNSFYSQILNSINNTVVKAIIGTILFQYIIFIIILKTSDPTYWRLFMSLVILVSLINYKQLINSFSMPLALNKVIIQSTKDELQIRNLGKSFNLGIDKKDIFNEVNVSFKIGLNLIKGSNGCGKSTFLKLIKGIHKFDKGEVIYGNRIYNNYSDSNRPFFFISQNPFDILAQDLSIIENLIISTYKPKYHNIFISKKGTLHILFSKLTRYNLTAIEDINSSFWFKPSKTLSSGQAFVIAFYMSILSEKPVLLYDEPTTGLDSLNLEKIISLIGILSKEKIIIATTHDTCLDSGALNIYSIEKGKFNIVK